MTAKSETNGAQDLAGQPSECYFGITKWPGPDLEYASQGREDMPARYPYAASPDGMSRKYGAEGSLTKRNGPSFRGTDFLVDVFATP
jgi:hypothetical protein